MSSGKGNSRLRGSSSRTVVNSDDETQDTLLDQEMERGEGAEDNQNYSAQENDVEAISHPPTLDPDALWFDHYSVASTITKILQSFYDEPYTCWSNAKPHAKEFWWFKFQQSFKWDKKHATLVEQGYQKKAAGCLKCMVHRAAKANAGKIIPWLSTDVRNSLKSVRADGDFKKKSEQCKLNRLEGEKKGIKHSQGSISASEIAKREKRKTGADLTAADLYRKTHTKKDKSMTSEKAQKIWDDYESQKAIAQAKGSTRTDNEIFYDAAGGWTKKGTFFGLGNSVGNYFKKPTKLTTTNDILAPSPSIVSQLKGELESTTSELKETKEKLADALNRIEGFEKTELSNKNMIIELQKQFMEFSEVLRRNNSDDEPDTPPHSAI